MAGSVTYLAGEYVGGSGDQVRITWHVTSDGAWDDSDCLYYSNGALQMDDVTVTMTNGDDVVSTFDDFETGVIGDNWTVEFPQGVGDYAHIVAGLDEIDPCAENLSPVVCFIADDIMLDERGLPTQACDTWCYAPGGYVVHSRGGLAGPAYHIHNAIESPVIPWPGDDYLGASYLFDMYRHQSIGTG